MTTEIADKKDQRDPTTVGLLILSRKDRSVPAHVEADRVLNGGKNGAKRDT
jgi:hypothetical protein